MKRGWIALGALGITIAAGCGDEGGGGGESDDGGAAGNEAGGADPAAGGAATDGGSSATDGGSSATDGGSSATHGGSSGIAGTGTPGVAGEGGAPKTGAGGEGVGGGIGEGGAGGTASKVQWLGKCTPHAFSKDAKTVLADEGVWTAETGWQALPDLPGGAVSNSPRALSRDGKVVFGNSASTLGNEMYRWTAETGIEGLGVTYLPFAASLDGSVAVGWTTDNAQEDAVPFRWTSSSGFEVFDSIEFISIFSSSHFIDAHLSAAGDIAQFSFNRDRARWNSTDGFEVIYDRIPRATAMSADGMRIALVETGTTFSYDSTGTCFAERYYAPPYAEPAFAPPLGCGIALVEEFWVALLDYDDSGTRGVGIQFDNSGRYAPFYWSEKAGMWPLIDLLPDGIDLWRTEVGDWRDSYPPHPYLAGDGRVVLAQTADAECFVSEIDEPTRCVGCSSEPDVEYLGRCVPYELSDDGSTVLAEQGIWTAQTGWVRPRVRASWYGPDHYYYETFRLLSGNGKVAVGVSGNIYDFSGDGTFVLLGNLDGEREATPLAINHDGSIVLAWHTDSALPSGATKAAFWAQATGLTKIALPAGYGPITGGSQAVLNAAGDLGYFADSDKPGRLKWSLAAPTQATFEGPDIPTALNDDGSNLALVKLGITGDLAYDVQATGTCLYASDPEAPPENPCAESTVVLTDYDQSGTSGVGWEWHHGFLYAAFYWSADGGMQRLDDVLPPSAGIQNFPAAPIYSSLGYIGLEAHPHISADGTKVLSIDYQSNCYLTTIAQ